MGDWEIGRKLIDNSTNMVDEEWIGGDTLNFFLEFDDLERSVGFCPMVRTLIYMYRVLTFLDAQRALIISTLLPSLVSMHRWPFLMNFFYKLSSFGYGYSANDIVDTIPLKFLHMLSREIMLFSDVVFHLKPYLVAI